METLSTATNVNGSGKRGVQQLLRTLGASQVSPLALKKLLLLALLSVQIGFQPLLMTWYAKDTTSVALRVAVIECFKLLLAFVPLMASGTLWSELKSWSWRHALQTTAFPALIYVMQNYLNQNAVVALDGVTFNVLNQTKIIWTALLVYVMLRQYQSRPQLVALFLLCAAAVLMTTSSVDDKESRAERQQKAANDASGFFTGAYQALIAAILSALAGTIIQRALQNQKRNTYVVTVELSLIGLVTLCIWTFTSSSTATKSPKALELAALAPEVEPHELAAANQWTKTLWQGWTVWTFLALLLQATGGVVVGFVIKYCGNVEKSFAVVAGMIITALLESIYNHKPFGWNGLLAISMVALSTFLYTRYPAPNHLKYQQRRKLTLPSTDDYGVVPVTPCTSTGVSSSVVLSSSVSNARERTMVESVV